MEAYEAPDITEVGSVEELTQGDFHSGVLDMDYPSGTPDSALGFSIP